MPKMMVMMNSLSCLVKSINCKTETVGEDLV
jgi:hypothetical protein